MDQPAHDDQTILINTIRISNLHCSSCVHIIEEALSALSPPPTCVQVSIVSQAVTVHYPRDLSPAIVQSTLEDVGFDIWTSLSSGRSFNGISETVANADRQREHVKHCSLCREGELPVSPDQRISGINAQVSRLSMASESLVQLNHIAPVAFPHERHNEGPFRVVLSVGGMSCSSCSMTITKMVSDFRGVSDVTVSLLSNSAIVIVEDKGMVDEIVKTIEDCGFEAEMTSSESLTALDCGSTQLRTLTLRIDGMFSQRCPEKIMAAIESLSPQINIIKPVTACTDHTLELSYQPSSPSLTIRKIISTIASAKSPPFHVSIDCPPSLEDRARSMQANERSALLRRLTLAVVISIPTFVIGVVFMSLVKDGNRTRALLMKPMWIGNVSRSQWALLFLASPVQFYSAGIFHRKSIKEIRALWRRGSTSPVYKRFIRYGSMNLLVSAGVSVGYFSSVGLLGLAAAQPASPSGMGDITTYFDSVVFLTMFLLAGRYLEAYSKARTADAISALALLRPTEALLLSPIESFDNTVTSKYSDTDDLEKGDIDSAGGALSTNPCFKVEKIAASLLDIGDIVRIQCGATPPADATIISSIDSAFDESSLTGESRLIKKTLGDKIFLGTVNKGGMIDARVESIGGTTMLDHIVEVVREGQTRRAPIERVADLLIGYFVPVVTLLAIITWVIWLSLGSSGALPRDFLDISIGGWAVWSLEFAIAVFVVACPCGIGLAAPTALLVGSGLAAKFGILARGGGEAFQGMAQVDIVVFDKTGTLTEGGDATVSGFEIFDTSSRWEPTVLLGIAAELESASSHPLGTAIRSFCGARNASPLNSSMLEETAGRGLEAHFEHIHCSAIIGNESWFVEHGTVLDDTVKRQLEKWKSEAKSVILLGIRDESGDHEESFVLAAIFAVADRLRPEAQYVVSSLQHQGIGTWMISGDNAVTARAVAQAVGIPMTNVIAGVLPHEKAQKIQWLQQVGAKRRRRSMFAKRTMNKRCIVAMVGDGINDAPALTAADIGIAIGSGSDVAISSASFILLSSNLRCLLTLSDLSRKVFNRVKLNFLCATMYNVVALPIAAGVIYPAGRIRLAPVWASLAMALSSVSVVCSSLLLKLYKEPKVSL